MLEYDGYKYLTYEEAANMLGIKYAYVRQLVSNKKLASYQLDTSRHRYILYNDIEAYIKANKRLPALLNVVTYSVPNADATQRIVSDTMQALSHNATMIKESGDKGLEQALKVDEKAFKEAIETALTNMINGFLELLLSGKLRTITPEEFVKSLTKYIPEMQLLPEEAKDRFSSMIVQAGDEAFTAYLKSIQPAPSATPEAVPNNV